MITYEEAKKKALKVDKGIDKAYEYSDAYVFVNSKEKYDGEIVIMKKTGNAVSMSDYAAMSTDTSELKKIKF